MGAEGFWDAARRTVDPGTPTSTDSVPRHQGEIVGGQIARALNEERPVPGWVVLLEGVELGTETDVEDDWVIQV